jgi:hypothetical protein
MAKGQSSTANNAAGFGLNTIAANATPQAFAAYQTAMPELQAEATNPQGYSPTDLAAMQTGAMQTAGGSTAGATGQGSLLGARTRNSGTTAAAIPAAARGGAQEFGNQLLGIREGNAKLKESQKQAGLGGLTGLYGTGLSEANAGLGETANNVNASANAQKENNAWTEYLANTAMKVLGAGTAD